MKFESGGGAWEPFERQHGSSAIDEMILSRKKRKEVASYGKNLSKYCVGISSSGVSKRVGKKAKTRKYNIF